MPRRKQALHWEGQKANLSQAGWSVIVQGNVAPGASANASYTVTGGNTENTRRVVISWPGTEGQIRFNYNAAATVTSFALAPAVYTIIDADVGDTLQFFNTSGGVITVTLLEIE